VYFALIALLLFVLPIASIRIESMMSPPLSAEMVCKWFAFWAVGVRLALAGLTQMIRPQVTQKILGIAGNESRILVRELGFANFSFGVLGIASFFAPSWQTPAALAGGIFLLLAGANHLLQPHRNPKENVAMISDLFVGVVLLGCVFLILR
jgi:hypothetical protein